MGRSCLGALQIMAAALRNLRHDVRLLCEPVWAPGEVPCLLQRPVDGGKGVPAAALPKLSHVSRPVGRQLRRLGRRAEGGKVAPPRPPDEAGRSGELKRPPDDTRLQCTTFSMAGTCTVDSSPADKKCAKAAPAGKHMHVVGPPATRSPRTAPAPARPRARNLRPEGVCRPGGRLGLREPSRRVTRELPCPRRIVRQSVRRKPHCGRTQGLACSSLSGPPGSPTKAPVA